jgi:hypothetical protein
MAIPPDPLEEVLPRAGAAVMAEVTRVVSEDPQKPFPRAEAGTTSAGGEVARQVVELKVQEALFGKLSPGAVVRVVKPAGEYKLIPGNKGPFLLDVPQKGEPTILGRYGPDSYGRQAIESAARAAGKR